jgi:hypothetical protein
MTPGDHGPGGSAGHHPHATSRSPGRGGHHRHREQREGPPCPGMARVPGHAGVPGAETGWRADDPACAARCPSPRSTNVCQPAYPLSSRPPGGQEPRSPAPWYQQAPPAVPHLRAGRDQCCCLAVTPGCPHISRAPRPPGRLGSQNLVVSPVRVATRGRLIRSLPGCGGKDSGCRTEEGVICALASRAGCGLARRVAAPTVRAAGGQVRPSTWRVYTRAWKVPAGPGGRRVNHSSR